MNRFVAIILLLGVLSQVLSKPLAVIEYKLNKVFISNELCIKKAIPGNDCAGKCHLKKELSKDDQDQSARDSKSKTFSELNWITGSKVSIEFYLNDLISVVYIKNQKITRKMTGEVFHPPGAFAFAC